MLEKLSSYRGATDTLGYMLVLIIIMGSIIAVYAVGFDLLESQRDIEVDRNIERTLNVFLTNEQEVFSGSAPSRSTEIKLVDNEIELEKNTSEMQVYIPSDDTTHLSRSGRIHFTTPLGEYIHEFSGLVRNYDNSNTVQMTEPPESMVSYSSTTGMMHIHMYGSSMKSKTLQGGIRNVIVTRSDMNIETYDFAGTEQVEITIISPHPNLWKDYLSNKDSIDTCEPTGVDQITCTTQPIESLYVQQSDVHIQAI